MEGDVPNRRYLVVKFNTNRIYTSLIIHLYTYKRGKILNIFRISAICYVIWLHVRHPEIFLLVPHNACPVFCLLPIKSLARIDGFTSRSPDVINMAVFWSKHRFTALFTKPPASRFPAVPWFAWYYSIIPLLQPWSRQWGNILWGLFLSPVFLGTAGN